MDATFVLKKGGNCFKIFVTHQQNDAPSLEYAHRKILSLFPFFLLSYHINERQRHEYGDRSGLIKSISCLTQISFSSLNFYNNKYRTHKTVSFSLLSLSFHLLPFFYFFCVCGFYVPQFAHFEVFVCSLV
jgi:hypothetical protein